MWGAHAVRAGLPPCERTHAVRAVLPLRKPPVGRVADPALFLTPMTMWGAHAVRAVLPLRKPALGRVRPTPERVSLPCAGDGLEVDLRMTVAQEGEMATRGTWATMWRGDPRPNCACRL